MGTSPRGLILDGKQVSRRWHGDVGLVLLARGRSKERKGDFSNNPLDLFVITKTFKTETSHIYLGLLDKSKNHRKIHGDSQYYREAPRIFILNF